MKIEPQAELQEGCTFRDVPHYRWEPKHRFVVHERVVEDGILPSELCRFRAPVGQVGVKHPLTGQDLVVTVNQEIALEADALGDAFEELRAALPSIHAQVRLEALARIRQQSIQLPTGPALDALLNGQPFDLRRGGGGRGA